MSQQIADTFGIETNEITLAPKITNAVPATLDDFTKKVAENKKTDYISARDNVINLLQDMEQIIKRSVEETIANPSARMIESFSTLVKTFSEINKDLLSLTDKSSETNKVSTQVNEDSKVNNVIFVGTSDSLIEQIRKNI